MAIDTPPNASATAWSAGELRTLAAVFDTFVPGDDAEGRALAAADVLASAIHPTDLRQLRLAIRALEWRPANLATGQRPVRFRDLDRRARERFLLRMAESPVPQRRSVFQALKRLGSFLAYALPDEGSVARLAAIGYRDEPAAAPASPSPVVPLAVVESAALLRLEADAVVVGSGAGGGVLADRLTEAGWSVLVIEAGQWIAEADFPRNESEGFDRLYLDRGLTATRDLSVAILAGATVGGGTTINWTTCIDPPADIRAAWADEHGLAGFDGSETDADLSRLRDELGVQPPATVPPKDQLILDGAAALGWEAGTTVRDAAGCSECGACGFGCQRGTKQSGLRAHLARAIGRDARLLAGATVERVLVEAGRARGVAGTVATVGGRRPFEVRASRGVVLAAGALRTPVVLRRSALEHAAIGRHLRIHPVPVVAARLDAECRMWQGVQQAARSLEFLSPGGPSTDGPGPAHGGFIIESAPGHPGLIALCFPWQGADHAAGLMADVRFFSPLISICRDRGEGRLLIGRSGPPRIDYRIASVDVPTARRALVEMARLARAGGTHEQLALGTPARWWRAADGEAGWRRYLDDLATFDFRPNRGFLFSAHQMGTARAGADPRMHACDPWGRVRQSRGSGLVDGLWVADASLFPSSVGVNPMLSVMALAARVARAMTADAPAT